jgi:hypothetical protein
MGEDREEGQHRDLSGGPGRGDRAAFDAEIRRMLRYERGLLLKAFVVLVLLGAFVAMRSQFSL